MSSERTLDYLRLLATQYPTIQAASTAIINLSAQLNLPKGTEHFLSDIHGEYEAFRHVLKNGSGSIKRRIDELFANTLTDRERRQLATLIYYPEQKLLLMLKQTPDPDEWYRIMLFRIIRLCRVMSFKYTRAQVRAALPRYFADIIEELLHEQEGIENKQFYYQGIIDTIIAIGNAREFIVALAELIQRLAVARLHIIGDVYDRGPGAHKIVDWLLDHPNVDIQWGNHDIVWMGAAAGSEACMANVIRVSLRYANMETMENGYAISLLPLASFALDTYGNDECVMFRPKLAPGDEFTENEQRLMAKMHKAISIIQFKVEGQIIRRRQHYGMEDRLLLERIDYQAGTITLDGQTYPLLDTYFPTIDPANPYALNEGEQNVMERLRLSFTSSDKLQRHARFLFAKGSMYLVADNMLLYHGCIPLKPDGSFATLRIGGRRMAARAYLDHLDQVARQGYFATDDEQKLYGMDAMWYMWTGGMSPLFGKDKMATFERYFIDAPQTHREEKNAYYALRDRPETVAMILEAFGLDPEQGIIVNGHVPVEVRRGESPIKADGRLLVIDGGFAKAYQAKTGIAGYTLIANSWGLLLAAHEPFDSAQRAIEDSLDMHSQTRALNNTTTRIHVRDTDAGRAIERQIDDLKALLQAYRSGLLK